MNDELCLERRDVVDIVVPPTTITVANCEIVKVCPETVAEQWLNVIGALNSARRSGPCITTQKATVKTNGVDGCGKVADADWPVDRSVRSAVTVSVDGEKVRDPENLSPGETTRARRVGGEGAPLGPGNKGMTAAPYPGLPALPVAQRAAVVKKNP